jgi:signal transduction histidine kinase
MLILGPIPNHYNNLKPHTTTVTIKSLYVEHVMHNNQILTLPKPKGALESTKVLYGVENVTNTVLQFLSETNNTVDACVDYTRPSLIAGFMALKEAFLDVKKRGVKLRYVTEINKENISYCKYLLTIVDELRHLDGIKGNFYISETGYLAPATIHEKGRPAAQIIYSNVKEIIKHQRYVFESFWSRARPAEQRIREIEEGIESTNIEIIANPRESLKLPSSLIRSAKYEVLGIFPSANSFRRQIHAGVLHLFKEVLERGVRVRILIPANEEQINQILNEEASELPPMLDIRSTDKNLHTQMGIIVVDRKDSLIIELKDDTKDISYDAVGLAAYSNSKPIALSYTSVFEGLWLETQLFEKSRKINRRLRILNEKLKTSNRKQEEMRKELERINEELSVMNKYKDDFVMRISSESATILAEAKVLTEVLLETKDLGSLTNMQYTVVKVIYEYIAKINLLVKDLLDTYKLDRGVLRLSKAYVNIPNLIAQTLSEEDLSKLILENNIKINQDTSMIAPTETVYCDPERLQQVLSNLLRNAIEFVPIDGRGRITIRVEKQRQKQDREDNEGNKGNKKTQEITFTIEDNGIAVTKDEVQRLFQKFYLIDTKNDFAKRQKSTTLGLSVSRGIIEAHGGRIWIDETYKGGASFKFALPL